MINVHPGGERSTQVDQIVAVIILYVIHYKNCVYFSNINAIFDAKMIYFNLLYSFKIKIFMLYFFWANLINQIQIWCQNDRYHSKNENSCIKSADDFYFKNCLQAPISCFCVNLVKIQLEYFSPPLSLSHTHILIVIVTITGLWYNGKRKTLVFKRQNIFRWDI